MGFESDSIALANGVEKIKARLKVLITVLFLTE